MKHYLCDFQKNAFFYAKNARFLNAKSIFLFQNAAILSIFDIFKR